MIMSKNWLNQLSPSVLRLGMNIWPPFLGSGIKVTEISQDFRKVRVQLKMRFYNRNYVGTHFGGTLFAMTDPFYMLMLLKNLGPNYIVWDKASKIEFKKPAKGTIHAVFEMHENEFKEISEMANANQKYIFDKEVKVLNEHNEEVACVIKTLYVRKKD